MFAVVNIDAPAQASDFRIGRRQIAFLWWKQESNPGVRETHSPADWMPAHKRLSYRGSSEKKLELYSPSLWWASVVAEGIHTRTQITIQYKQRHLTRSVPDSREADNWSAAGIKVTDPVTDLVLRVTSGRPNSSPKSIFTTFFPTLFLAGVLTLSLL